MQWLGFGHSARSTAAERPSLFIEMLMPLLQGSQALSPAQLEVGTVCDSPPLPATEQMVVVRRSNALAEDNAEASHRCWGAEVRGSCDDCMPDFLTPDHSHFKDRFCSRCQQGVFDIPAERVCNLPPPLLQKYANTTSRSFWTQGARVVNQTARCIGQSLLIFKAVPPREVVEAAVALPAAIIRDSPGGSFVGFVLMHGTLVPKAAGSLA